MACVSSPAIGVRARQGTASRPSTRAALLLLLCYLPLAAAAGPQRVIIVKSSDNAYYAQTIATLSRHAAAAVEFDAVPVDAFEPAPAVSLYIALGQAAADRVSRLAGDTPVINAYLTLEQYHRLDGGRHFTVLLDQPLNRYLAFSKYALQVDSVGIMTETPIRLDRAERDLLRDLLLDANQYQVGPDSKLLPTLRRLLQDNDALLMLPRQAIYNRDSLKGVLMTSYRSRKPVVSYSPAHVKSGALASIYSSPADIGRHLSLVVNDWLQNGAPRDPDFRFARFYSISLNSSVARALGLNLPNEAQLRQRLDGLAR